MTIAELIAALQKFDPSLRVVIGDRRGGDFLWHVALTHDGQEVAVSARPI